MSLVGKAPMPILLDPVGIVRLDDVNGIWLLRKLNCQFMEAPSYRICAS